jgi:nucleoside-diphosphate-sugar epimerase
MSTKIIAVFGSTGAQGSSVVRALLANGSYQVRALTDNVNSDKAKDLASQNNCTVVKADLDNVDSLMVALQECYGVFLVTSTFFGQAICENGEIDEPEIRQGKNAIDSAIACGVSHFVFSGVEPVRPILNQPCNHFDFKAAIEQYGLNQRWRINFTSVRLPGYFEKLVEECIRKVKPNVYLMNVPMDGKAMYVMGVEDLGECVVSIFQDPKEYQSQVVGLASEKLTVAEIVATMNKHLAPNQFIDTKITLKQFAALGFPAAQELAVMYEYLQSGRMPRDIYLTKKLNKNLLTFEQWIVKNRESILNKI